MKRRISLAIITYSIVLGVALLYANRVSAQASYGMLKSGIIVQFGRHITWPDKKDINEYKVGIVGTDTATYNHLKTSIGKANIHGKPFTLRWVIGPDDVEGLHMLYINKEESNNLTKYAKAIENKHILLITEESPDTKNIMLNIYIDDKTQKLSFEVNKANIIIENLELDPELLLLGGTEVDVRALYREIKLQFEEERLRAEKQQKLVAEQQKAINSQRNQIVINDFEIGQLKKNTNQLAVDIKLKERSLWELSNSVTQQERLMKDQMESMAAQKQMLHNQKMKLKDQEALIDTRSTELDSLVLAGEKQRETIAYQSSSLESKEQIIDLQKRVIAIVLTFGLVLIALSFIIFKIYRARQKLSNKLENSYSTLREQHHSILQLNEELNTINEMLEEKVKERTKVLEERNVQLTEYAFINSHLLRAPLSQILGLLNLLIREKLPIKDQQIVKSLSKSSHELDTIIRKISDLLYDGKDFDRQEIEAIINRKFKEHKDQNFRDN